MRSSHPEPPKCWTKRARFDCKRYAVARRDAARWTATPGGRSSLPTQTGLRMEEGHLLILLLSHDRELWPRKNGGRSK
jgi:hypothetical protein